MSALVEAVVDEGLLIRHGYGPDERALMTLEERRQTVAVLREVETMRVEEARREREEQERVARHMRAGGGN